MKTPPKMTIFYDISFSMKKSKKFLKITPFFSKVILYTKFLSSKVNNERVFFSVDDPLEGRTPRYYGNDVLGIVYKKKKKTLLLTLELRNLVYNMTFEKNGVILRNFFDFFIENEIS